MATKVSIKECQYAEFKQSWQDEYLKWICAFANTEGGSLFVGVDDKGYVCGVKNAHKLSEDIPNKIRNTMGVICEMRLLNAGGLDYFEIKVDKYPVPISYRGRYYNIELACEEIDSKLPKPKAEFGGLTVECRASDQYKELASKWNIGGANRTINPPINKTQQVLLDLVKENNNYTYDDLASLTNKHRDTVRENLKKLQELGLIRRVGARKNGHWEILRPQCVRN